MSKSAIYTVNSNAQTVGVGESINLGRIERRFGSNINLEGNAITITGNGYYKIDANITFIGTAAGVVTVSLYKDGVIVPGAFSSKSTTEGTTYDIGLTALVRKVGCMCDSSSLSVVVSGASANIQNIAIVAEKE